MMSSGLGLRSGLAAFGWETRLLVGSKVIFHRLTNGVTLTYYTEDNSDWKPESAIQLYIFISLQSEILVGHG